jgi:hypothetical protein
VSTVSGLGAILGSKTIADSSTAHAHLDVDAYLPSSVGGPSTFLMLYANSDAIQSAVSLEAIAQTWTFRLRASNATVQIKPRVGAWNHISIDVTFASSNSAGKATIGYTDNQNNTQQTGLADSTLPGGSMSVTQLAAQIGVQVTAVTSASTSAYYDNVTFSPF